MITLLLLYAFYTLTSSIPAFSGAGDTLLLGQGLTADQALVAQNGLATLTLQGSDGNLVLRSKNGQVLWATYTTGFSQDRFVNALSNIFLFLFIPSNLPTCVS